MKQLMGSGDRIGLFTMPFVVVGVILNLAFPAAFQVGGPPDWLRLLSIGILVPGVVIWLWAVILVLRDVPRGRLISSGPYGWVKHPIYAAVAILVIPWAGFLLDSWLGVVIGTVLYVATRRYAPAEEAELSRTFGETWYAYQRRVRLQWL